MEETKRIIEINGVKVEVDLREATQVSTYRVGMRVKVITRPYDTAAWKVHQGVIVAFDAFKSVPTITVCYIETSGDLEFAYLNADSKNVEIAPANDELMVEKADVLNNLQREIAKHETSIAELEQKRDYFLVRFGAWFELTD